LFCHVRLVRVVSVACELASFCPSGRDAPRPVFRSIWSLFLSCCFGSTEVSACPLGSHVFWRPGMEFGFELREYFGLSGRRFAQTQSSANITTGSHHGFRPV
jgi:hypothetical protein